MHLQCKVFATSHLSSVSLAHTPTQSPSIYLRTTWHSTSFCAQVYTRQVLLTKMYKFLIASKRSTCTAHPLLLDLITVWIIGGQDTSHSFALCNFLCLTVVPVYAIFIENETSELVYTTDGKKWWRDRCSCWWLQHVLVAHHINYRTHRNTVKCRTE